MGRDKRPGFGGTAPTPSKTPRYGGAAPDSSKTPRTGQTVDYRHMKPTWRLGRMDMEPPWGWQGCGASLHDIHSRLSQYETMTFMEILKNDSTGCHHIEVSRLCNDAQKRLKDLKQDDIDELLSIRVSKKERIWGIRANEIVWILWWDPLHEVYPVATR